ncbi:AMP-dependent synthetase/ligase [Acetivibrio cellulolyticus]|uniref:AMP-dependent synthetase/ligase n=1 Tax=Acetivibrio cellulolyticus TaxID=35830 RepID=UPI0001E2E7B3|nr:AMP-binding protein [Acetivibrio cellulolyticus]
MRFSESLYQVRKIDNLKDMIEQSVKLFGSKNAFLIKGSDSIYNGITYDQFKKDIDYLGTALTNLGLKDGFIAVVGENRYEWCVTYLATINGVGVIVPMDKELPACEMQNLLSISNAEAIVFSGKLGNKIKEILGSLESVKYYIDMDLKEDSGEYLSFAKLIEKGRKLVENGDKEYLDAEIDNNKMSALIFTSGTTDSAKGVMLSHGNICANIISVCSTVHVDENDSSLSILPLHHTYECTLGFLLMMYKGGTLAFCEGLKHIVKNLKEVKPTVLISVPLLLESIYKKIWDQVKKKRGAKTLLKIMISVNSFLRSVLKMDLSKKLFKKVHENLGGRIRLVITGAAAIDPIVPKGFRKLGIPILQGYGLTECSPLVIGNRDKQYIDSSIGLPIPRVEVKIKDPDENGIGELIVKGPNIMLGYFNNEEATKRVIRDGWFHTGDLGKKDKSGFYYITGRIKNVIITKNGKNIFPEELETYINRSPFVQESFVYGKFDKTSGDTQVNVQIFPNIDVIKEKFKEVNISKEQIMEVLSEVIKNVNRNIPLYKHIKGFTIRDNDFIKTTTQKIKRYVEIQKTN